MSLPLVSVIIPAYKARDWIEETLAGVLGQTYPHAQLEIILIDDGSTDTTRAVAERALSSSDIEFSLQTIANVGPSAARNVGWRAARGEWIQFLDADDLIEPNKIEFQMRAAHETAPHIAAVYSEWGRIVFTAQSWKQADAWVMPDLMRDPLRALLGSNNHIATGSQLFRRAWLERVGGYNPAYDLIEDVDLHLRMVMGGGDFVPRARDNPCFGIASARNRCRVPIRLRSSMAVCEMRAGWKCFGANTTR